MSAKDRELYDAIEAMAIRTRGVKFQSKSDSPLMQLFCKGMVLVPGMNAGRFMESITTHLGGTVYWPRKYAGQGSSWAKSRILAHELVHRDQELEHGAWFFFSYAGWRLLILPWALAALITLIHAAWFFYSLLVIGDAIEFWWSLLGWTLLVSAVLLPPWPIGTAHWEYPAYAVSMWMDHRRGVDIRQPRYLDFYVYIFTGPVYYYMQWSKRSTREKLEIWRDRVLDGKLSLYVPTINDLDAVVSEYYPES